MKWILEGLVTVALGIGISAIAVLYLRRTDSQEKLIDQALRANRRVVTREMVERGRPYLRIALAAGATLGILLAILGIATIVYGVR